jgi:hypothetical protein
MVVEMCQVGNFYPIFHIYGSPTIAAGNFRGIFYRLQPMANAIASEFPGFFKITAIPVFNMSFAVMLHFWKTFKVISFVI